MEKKVILEKFPQKIAAALPWLFERTLHGWVVELWIAGLLKLELFQPRLLVQLRPKQRCSVHHACVFITTVSVGPSWYLVFTRSISIPFLLLLLFAASKSRKEKKNVSCLHSFFFFSSLALFYQWHLVGITPNRVGVALFSIFEHKLVLQKDGSRWHWSTFVSLATSGKKDNRRKKKSNDNAKKSPSNSL